MKHLGLKDLYIQLAYVVSNASPVTAELKTSNLRPTQKKARKERRGHDCAC